MSAAAGADPAADGGVAAHHVEVPRTARYYTAGDPAAARLVWVALHGYGQLAGYFVRHFAAHARPGSGRLVVAPEALSRFYVGREDREAEIADYVRYLDLALDAGTAGTGPERAALPLGVLAFSQGAATACRWVAHRHRRGLAAPRALVLWGGALPHDFDLDGADGAALRATRLTLVAGDADEFATPSVVAQQEARLRAAGVPYAAVRYAGGHRLDAAVLGGVLAAAEAPEAVAPGV